MIKIPKSKIILLLATLYFLPSSASHVFAAELFFASEYDSAVRVGEEFELSLLLNTQGEYINALEGTVNIPARLEARSINSGNSFINLWIQPLRIEKNKIYFAGIVPGGYVGERGTVFSVMLRARDMGTNIVTVEKAQALLNDGLGTAARLVTRRQTIIVSAPSQSAVQRPVTPKVDRDPPSAFVPTIAQDANVFDGKKFLIFVTQDKQSGIDRYEVSEGKNNWRVAESPYLLQNQESQNGLRVRAIDRAGNMREWVMGSGAVSWYLQPWLWIILIVCFVLFLLWLSLRSH